MELVLETERLLLRKLTSTTDTAFVLELLNSPGYLQFIGDKNVKTTEQAAQFLENGPLKSYRENGFGMYAVVQKESQIPIGMCGLLKRDLLAHPDLGYAFLPGFHGKGYALEAARATLSIAFDSFKIPLVYAFTDPDNAHSIGLLGKLGMQYQGPFFYTDKNKELNLYAVSVL
ncbi:GNAT family N-acetyltransferase [Arundinibacter roseus]|uniref:N-acetyltransferase n=1 Tax=Arundinibacter roseus TaxID=2070510 RepID=A0A4R4KCH3_9BACT|nr:GNAT family N-acetyltransferase [Arundinibacter roseus]TDB64171.1 N-acetyltransferase [Arundinibacter roseus]